MTDDIEEQLDDDAAPDAEPTDDGPKNDPVPNRETPDEE